MTGIDVRLRLYQPDDLAATALLWYETWTRTFPDLAHPHTPAAFVARFRDEIATGNAIWLAEDADTIVGFVALDARHGVIDQLFVSPDAQGVGIGAVLMAKAKALSPAGLTLHTLARNTRARAFYERHDFHPGNAGINAVNGQESIAYHWWPARGDRASADAENRGGDSPARMNTSSARRARAGRRTAQRG